MVAWWRTGCGSGSLFDTVHSDLRLVKLLFMARSHVVRSSNAANWALFHSANTSEVFFTFTTVERVLLFSRGNLKPASGATARFNTVDLSSVFLPPFTKSMSSLSPRDSLICPTANKAWSIQSCALQFFLGIGCGGGVFTAGIIIFPSDDAKQYPRMEP